MWAAGSTSLELVEALLLAWFEAHGRDLPWRRTSDPYAILVSEVMLQQTQVERVIPRYLAWLERWPTPAALAAAPPADVIRAWQGLGYNRRGLNLHRAARAISEHGWPEDLTDLPGVGPYTAAAIRNQAFGEPVLPVDTNVARIQERTGHAFGPKHCKRSSTSAPPCVSRVCRDAGPARSPANARRAVAGTSRSASSPGSTSPSRPWIACELRLRCRPSSQSNVFRWHRPRMSAALSPDGPPPTIRTSKFI